MVHVNGKWQQFLKSQDPTPQRRIKIGELPEHCEGFPCNIHWPT